MCPGLQYAAHLSVGVRIYDRSLEQFHLVVAGEGILNNLVMEDIKQKSMSTFHTPLTVLEMVYR